MKKIKIFQISCSEETCSGCNYRHGESCLNKFQSLKQINGLEKDCYKLKYSYETESEVNDATLLEKVFEKFNIDHPQDYKGHSLSVSDIIAIDDKHYYCNSIGFKEIKFGKRIMENKVKNH